MPSSENKQRVHPGNYATVRKGKPALKELMCRLIPMVVFTELELDPKIYIEG